MDKGKLLPISIICFSLALVISSFTIANGLMRAGQYISDGISIGHSNLGRSLENAINNTQTGNNRLASQKDVMSIFEAAEYLRINEDSVRYAVSTLGLPAVKLGENYIFSRSAIDKWLETYRNNK